ncbi:unnamed protein product [Auanema sp. JU1783]|nr:unnamed protein product [Auanema sp. JU1783]
MGTADRAKAPSGVCSLTNLVLIVVAVVASLTIGAVLSWYFTKLAYSPSNPRDDAPSQDSGPSAVELRLPRSVEPVSYDLTIKTYLPGYVDIPKEKNLTFDGQLTINLVTLKSLRKFVLNAKNLTIKDNKCSLTVNNEPVKIKRVMMIPHLEKVAFDLDDEVKEGSKVELKIKYNGLINNNLGGLYQSVYQNADGTTKIAAVTQMEATEARQMVPCLDEPEYKAPWTISVIHPKGTKALSNGYPLNITDVKDEFQLTTFEETPKMSSYLLAILVSDFEHVKAKGDHRVEFRVWGPKQAKEHLEYAAEVGQKCLEYYEKYFKIPFPLKKIDMVALPDFAAGAMENWGLITYRENSLLYDKKLWPPKQKRRVASVIAHELAHQWFGNLVTMKWWDDLWLNEGFATYVEYLGANEMSDGNYKMQDYFVEKSLSTAFDADNQANTHPLSFKIDKAAEVAEAFDSISYDKGASIIRMIKNVMKEDKFNEGLFEYLTTHSYANAQAADLWTALNNHSEVIGPSDVELDIPKFASQWTTQMGFPYLTVENVNDTSVRIYQTRYKLNPDAKEKEKYANPTYKFKWDVPVWYKAGDKTEKMVWLSRDDDLYLNLGENHKEEPIVLNVEARSYFRQNYDVDGWKKIIKQLKADHTVYSNVTRYAIISDAFAMAAIEKVDYSTLFDLLDFITSDTDYMPTSAFIDGMKDLEKYFGTEPEARYYDDYVSKMIHIDKFKETYHSIAENYLDETQYYKNMRELRMFRFVCNHGSVECNSLLKETFTTEVTNTCKSNQLLSKCVSIAAPLREHVYCAGVKNGDQGVFEKMLQYYKKEPIQMEQTNILTALGCSQDPVTLKSLLLMAIERGNVIRFQDVSSVFQYVSKNKIGMELLFKFLVEHWNEIHENFKSDIATLGRIISYCIANIRNEAELNQLIEFRRTAPHASEYSMFSLKIEIIQTTIEWIKKNYKTVTKLLRDRV